MNCDIAVSAPSESNRLSLKEVVSRLMASPLVDGIAEFGSSATGQADSSSDYDLLLLVSDLPARVFQMVTTIDGSLADIVLVDVETAEALINSNLQIKPGSFEALFAQKMQTAHIQYDASERLSQAKKIATNVDLLIRQPADQWESDLYATWFWQSFGLLHLERMARSRSAVHLSAVDMMLTSCFPATWRSYFDIRRLAWQGEKAAIRHWIEHDPEYFQKVTTCLEADSRGRKLAAYRDLVELTLEPIGQPFDKGMTAAVLAGENRTDDLLSVLAYWQSLLR